MHLAARVQNMSSHVPDDVFEVVAPDMRLLQISDLFGCTESYEHIQYVAIQRSVRLRIQFAVRKRACSAFSELNVRILIERLSVKKAIILFGALLHASAAFQNDRAKAVLDQPERAEKPRGPAPDHDDAPVLLFRLQKYLFLFPADSPVRFDRVYPTDIRLDARVQRFS